MIAVLNLDGREVRVPVPNDIITRLIFCPRTMLDGLPLAEIEAYVEGRQHDL